ncbi:MAG: hypothetical protein PHR92_02615 [Lachnospiraceae bacterium]|nr:hypothetical protein [Lachnospiraceae bacterium]
MLHLQEEQKRKRELWQNLFCLFTMLGIGIFLFWKCRCGFGNRDETFYLTIPRRLAQGDALFAQEWHLSQMAGVLLWPFVSLYLWIAGGTGGMILAFRYFCTAVWCAAAVFFYLRLKKESWLGAWAASVGFLFYIPFGIMALSYNSMGILTLLTALVIAATAEKHKKIQMGISGCFFSAAVLCCPYLVFVYLIYCGAVLLRRLLSGGSKAGILTEAGEGYFYWLRGKNWFCFTIGIMVSALAFLVFVFSRTTLEKILEAFPGIFQDPEHKMQSFFSQLNSYFQSIIHSSEQTPVLLFILLILALVILIDKKRYKNRALYFSVAVVGTAALLGTQLAKGALINCLMFFMNILGLFCYFLTRRRRVKELFYLIWIPGMLYSFCISLTSNQHFYASSSASAVAFVGSVVMAVMTAKELWQESSETDGVRRNSSSIAVSLLGLLLALQLGSEAVVRYHTIFWEDSVEDQTCLLTEGPEAGLYASQNKEDFYTGFLRDTEAVRSMGKDKTVLFLTKNTWLYLCTEARCGAYSAWLSGITDLTMERLKTYYEINPEKLPDAVYAEAKFEAQADWMCSQYGYTKSKTEFGFELFILKDDKA